MLNKETVKDMPIKSNKPPVKPSGSTVFPRPGPGNQAIIEDEMEVNVEALPACAYSPQIQGSVFQKNVMQGMKDALVEDKSSGLEPLS